MHTLVLASTSRYRKALLERFGLPFEVCAPDVDETALADERPEALVRRLAEAKARAVAARFPDALVIGSDQVAELDGAILGKPHTAERARAQLQAAAGRVVRFLTGLCLLDTRDGSCDVCVEPFDVHFRRLTAEEIARYIERERPLDCAGSFRSEGLGITLFERMAGDDPTALVGLPLIRLAGMLRKAGTTLP